jgi:heme oxygenase
VSALHEQAHAHPFVRDLRTGKLGFRQASLYLQQLEPVYALLEKALRSHPQPWARQLLLAGAAQAPKLQSLLAELRLAPEPSAYSVHLTHSRDEAAWIGHAYARLLGDVHGGQELRPLLAQALGLPKLGIFEYGETGLTAGELAEHYKACLNAWQPTLLEYQVAEREARAAFRLTIDVMQSAQEAH